MKESKVRSENESEEEETYLELLGQVKVVREVLLAKRSLAGNDAREHGNGHLNLLVPLVVARDVPEESHEGLGSRAVHVLAGHRRGRPVGLGVRTYLQTAAGLVLLRETRSLQSMVEPRRRRGHRKEAENRDKSQGSPPEGHHVRRSPAALIRVDF